MLTTSHNLRQKSLQSSIDGLLLHSGVHALVARIAARSRAESWELPAAGKLRSLQEENVLEDPWTPLNISTRWIWWFWCLICTNKITDKGAAKWTIAHALRRYMARHARWHGWHPRQARWRKSNWLLRISQCSAFFVFLALLLFSST